MVDSDRATVLGNFAVSRETAERLDAIIALLTKWQRTINLVAPSSLPHIWGRHVADSLQLLPLAGARLRWADLGSGGGFPALVVAAALAEQPDADVTLIESDTRKASFLREAVRVADLPATVIPRRIEEVAPAIAPGIEIVSARALAPLPKLLSLAAPFLAQDAVGLFLKGQDVDNELTEATKYWHIEASIEPSLTDSSGRILVVRSASPVGQAEEGSIRTSRPRT